MKFTLSWLKEYLDTYEPLEKIADKLTMIGLEVEHIDDKAKALASLKTVSDNGGLPMTYRQLAELKTVMLAGDTMPAADRDAILAQLTAPGNPYRSLALEQEALAQLGAGNTDAAIKILTSLRSDAEASGATQARADQLLTALGQPQPASN